MSEIINNIKDFVREVRSGKSLRVSSKGDFSVVNSLTSFFESFFGQRQSRWIEVSQAFRRALSELESVPITFNINKSCAVQEFNYQLFIDAGHALIEKLQDFDSEKVKIEKLMLERALIALLFRLENVNGGLSSSAISEDQFGILVEAARSWKFNQVAFHDSSLTISDMNILQEACRYREFIAIILNSRTLLEDFLEWVLRDSLPLRVYVEFPSMQKKIKDFDLSGRVGRVGGGAQLKILYIESFGDSASLQKVVTLPMEGRDTSILDDRRLVLFRGNYALSVREIFEEFAKKRTGSSKLEFMAEGIMNWNSFLWGWWDQDIQDYHLVDVDQPEWWKQLPEIEVLSLKEARKKFGKHLDGRHWNAAVIATRERATLDFEGAHAYSSIAIPCKGGRYAIYPFGKYSMEFPTNLIGALLNVGETLKATIAYPDENVYYTHRQRSRYSFALSEEQGLAYLESIKRDMQTARAGNLVYQIESENCAKWAHKTIEAIVGPHRIPNVFQMYFLHSEPHGLMEKVFSWIHKLPERWRQPFTLCIHFLFGGYKGLWIWEEGKRVWKSLTNHSFWKDTVIYHPSMLHKQQELGIIRKSVPLGVTFSKSHILHSFHGLHHKMVLFSEGFLKKGRDGVLCFITFLRDQLLSQINVISKGKKVFLIPMMDHSFEFAEADVK